MEHTSFDTPFSTTTVDLHNSHHLNSSFDGSLQDLDNSHDLNSSLQDFQNTSIDKNSSLNELTLFKDLQKTKQQLANMEKRKNKFRDELRSIKKKKLTNVFQNEFKNNYQEILESNFSKDQIRVFEMQSRNKNFKNRMKWSVESIKKGLQLKFVCGGTGYDEVRKLIPLPTTRTLTGRIQNLKFKNGLLVEVINFLAIKVNKMSEFDKECVLVIDEMYIEAGTQFDRSSNKVIGKSTFPSESKSLATNGLVIMLAGIATRWKQTVAYEFTGNLYIFFSNN